MKISITVLAAVSASPPVAITLDPAGVLNSTRTVPVGESMPGAIGGREIASAIVHLASDESAYTVGSEIIIDGGMSNL